MVELNACAFYYQLFPNTDVSEKYAIIAKIYPNFPSFNLKILKFFIIKLTKI